MNIALIAENGILAPAKIARAELTTCGEIARTAVSARTPLSAKTE